MITSFAAQRKFGQRHAILHTLPSSITWLLHNNRDSLSHWQRSAPRVSIWQQRKNWAQGPKLYLKFLSTDWVQCQRHFLSLQLPLARRLHGSFRTSTKLRISNLNTVWYYIGVLSTSRWGDMYCIIAAPHATTDKKGKSLHFVPLLVLYRFLQCFRAQLTNYYF